MAGARGPALPVVVVLGAAVACAPADPATWEGLVAPYAPGAPVLRGYVLEAPTRGHEHDVVFVARHPDDRVIEVHVVDRGVWPDTLETRSYGVAWEAPRTTAPPEDADAVTGALADALRAHDHGLPRADDLPLGEGDGGPRAQALRLLRRFGTRAVVPLGVPVAAGLVAWAARRAAWRDALRVAGVALGLRLGLGSWGPLHVNGQGGTWLGGALDPARVATYGPGYPELFGFVSHRGPPDLAVFAANAALSSLVPAAVVAAASLAGLGRARALLAGLLVAVDPVALRGAATESYLVPATLLAATAAALALRPGPSAWTALVALGALAARLHPVAWAPMAVAPLVGLPAGARAVGAAALGLGAGALLGSGVVVADTLGAIGEGRVITPIVDVSTPRVVAVAGLVAVGLLAPRIRALTPAAVAAALVDTLLRGTYEQSALWQASFDRLYQLPVLLLAVAMVPEGWTRSRVWAPGVAAALAAVLLAGFPTIRARTTDDAEHAWARAWLTTVPDGCRVLYVSRPDPVSTVVLPPRPGLELVGLHAQGPVNVAPWKAAPCLRYVRTSACATISGRRGCERVESMLELTEVARGELPAIPSHKDVTYREATVEVAAFEAR